MRKKIAFAAAATIVVALGIFFYYSPYIAVRNMKKAVSNRDADAISDYIDYPALRESLKANLNTLLLKNVANSDNNAFSALGSSLASLMINPMIDNMVSPEGLSLLISGEVGKASKLNGSGGSNAGSNGENKDNYVTMKYKSLNMFSVKMQKEEDPEQFVELIFKRHEIFFWKLSSIHFTFPTTPRNEMQTDRGNINRDAFGHPVYSGDDLEVDKRIHPERYAIDSNELFNEFYNNEAAAKLKYSDQAIYVTGKVAGIADLPEGTRTAILKEHNFKDVFIVVLGNEPMDVNSTHEVACVTGSDGTIKRSDYKIGEAVLLQGECMGLDDKKDLLMMQKCWRFN